MTRRRVSVNPPAAPTVSHTPSGDAPAPVPHPASRRVRPSAARSYSWEHDLAAKGPLAAADPWERRRQELLARCRAVAERFSTTFAFSHRTAAVLHGWPSPFDPSTLEVVQRVKPSRPGQGDVWRHHRPDLTDADIAWVDGLPVTTATRTALDGVLALGPREGLVLVDAALRDLAKVDPFRRAESLARQDLVRSLLVDELASLGSVRNVRRARELLRYGTGLAGSPGESRTRWLCLTAGLPEPICQWECWVGDHQYFSDMAWLADGPDWPCTVITPEYDGASKYGLTAGAAVAAFASEKEREDLIRELGAAVHRMTKERLADVPRAQRWLVAKFPPSVRSRLTARPLLAAGPLSPGSRAATARRVRTSAPR